MELNLYKVNIIHSVDLLRDGDLHIKPHYNDSPFIHPEIFPSTRVGRWETSPHVENYVELVTGENYKIQMSNFTWRRCLATVMINNCQVGQYFIWPNQSVTINGRQFTQTGTQSDLIEVRFTPDKFSESNFQEDLMTNQCPTPANVMLPHHCKETIIYVRLVAKRFHNPYNRNCPSDPDYPIII